MLVATPVIPSFTEVKIFPAASESFGKNPMFSFWNLPVSGFRLGSFANKASLAPIAKS